MAVTTAVDVLARMLDAYDSSDRSVHHVGATSMEEGGDALHVVLEVAVPVEAAGEGGTAGSPVSAALTEDGHLTVEYPTAGLTSVPSMPEAEVSAVPTSARVSEDQVLVTLEVTITPTATGVSDGRSVGDPERDVTGRPGPDADESEPGPDIGRGSGDGAAAPQGRVTANTGGDAVRDADTTEDAVRDADTETDPRGNDDGGGDVGEDADTGDADVGADGETADEFEAVRNEAVPPYEDAEYLRAIYHRYDTFSEMREAIAMDVSTETVRRYMIDVGIHDPSSYGSASNGTHGGEPSEVRLAEESSEGGDHSELESSIPDEHLVTDGIGLPDDLSLEAVQKAVVESSTVYQVTRALDLDQRRTRELLEQLDLLELVMHRVSDDHKRDVTYEDVANRLRRTAGTA